MFEHSVKVPRHFKVASTILQKVIKDSCSLKTLLFADNKYKHYRVDVLYALISEAVKHNTDLDEIFTKTNILTENPRLDPWLAKILAVELIYGKKTLPGKSKPELTVLSYKDEFLKHIDIPTYKTEEETLKKARPRFIRVNTNLLTTSDAIRQFQDDGYRFVRCTSKSYSEYLKQLESLDQYEFIQDFHVKSVFAFSPRTKFFNHPFYLENKIVLQNKATTLAVQLLAPPPGSVVLDMCAAPGMKATHVAAFMRNQGKVYAVERNEERYKTLCDFVEKTGSTCIQPMLADVLTIRKGQLDDVEYILLDPSCSGSGMDHSLHDYQESVRIARLTSLQEKLLKHAMSAFPKVKRIVYSTCSLYPEENERVVANTVSNCRVTWSVLNAKELLNNEWNNFGSGLYGFMGVRCLYARPESDYTTGFFVAVLEKTGDRHKTPKKRTESEHTVLNYENYEQNDESDYNNSENLFSKKKRKKAKSHESVAVCAKETNFESTVNSQGDCQNILNEFIHDKDRKKKSKKDEVFVINDLNVQVNDTLGDENFKDKFVEGGKKKKMKRKKEKIAEHDEISEMPTEEISNELIYEKERKKHKKEKGLSNEGYSENRSKENESYLATVYMESIDSDNKISDNNGIKRKKKQKKDKTQSGVELDTSRDKESKKNKSNSESIELICDRQVLSETVLDDAPIKKKKKKKEKIVMG